MVSEVICYRGKSALREVGKVFGFSLEQIDRLSTIVSWWDKLDDIAGKRLADAGFDAHDRRIERVLAMATAIQGFPRHLSIHVGGFVLSKNPLVQIAPVEPATMPGRTIIPWDKDDIDTLRFFKVDVLGLGILTAIRKALALAQHDPRVAAPSAIDQLAKIPAEDPRVYDALCEADTVGVFQIESRAQMAMLPRLRPRTFYDLTIEVAIVRPGPIQGGMIHPYLRRRRGDETVEPPHPLLETILGRTLGVPLFQEQVMQIAITGAGYTPGEADQLRRDMAAWRRTGSLERHRARLESGFASRGIAQEFAEQLYKQIHGFAEYGFPESHASSFALLVYATGWLKVHHPAEFAAALVNSQPMGFYSVSTILQDAQKHGVEIRPIAIERLGLHHRTRARRARRAARGAPAGTRAPRGGREAHRGRATASAFQEHRGSGLACRSPP
jgi:error-prone DNA polymerase